MNYHPWEWLASWHTVYPSSVPRNLTHWQGTTAVSGHGRYAMTGDALLHVTRYTLLFPHARFTINTSKALLFGRKRCVATEHMDYVCFVYINYSLVSVTQDISCVRVRDEVPRVCDSEVAFRGGARGCVGRVLARSVQRRSRSLREERK
jgi:hypothetical protein